MILENIFRFTIYAFLAIGLTAIGVFLCTETLTWIILSVIDSYRTIKDYLEH